MASIKDVSANNRQAACRFLDKAIKDLQEMRIEIGAAPLSRRPPTITYVRSVLIACKLGVEGALVHLKE